jgi:hypothetical protein
VAGTTDKGDEVMAESSQDIIDRGRALEAKALAAVHVKNLSIGQFSPEYDCVELTVYYTTQSGERRPVGRHIRLPRDIGRRLMQFIVENT